MKVKICPFEWQVSSLTGEVEDELVGAEATTSSNKLEDEEDHDVEHQEGAVPL